MPTWVSALFEFLAQQILWRVVKFMGTRLKSRRFSFFTDLNNPKSFPELNLDILKREIDHMIQSPSDNFNRLIKKVSLYRGLEETPYILVMELPDKVSQEDISDYGNLNNHWALYSALRESLGDNFRWLVYRKKSDAEADPYLENWMPWLKAESETLPEDLVMENYKWTLYKAKRQAS